MPFDDDPKMVPSRVLQLEHSAPVLVVFVPIADK